MNFLFDTSARTNSIFISDPGGFIDFFNSFESSNSASSELSINITSNILYAVVKYEYEKNGENFLNDYDSQKFQILAQHLERE